MSKTGYKGPTYHMELVGYEAELVTEAVNRGIDAHLQGVMKDDSSFEWGYTSGSFTGARHALICDIAPNCLAVILRRLLEMAEGSEDDEGHPAEDLVTSIVYNLASIEDFWLTIDEEFYISREGHESEYVSVFDKDYWPALFSEVLQEEV